MADHLMHGGGGAVCAEGGASEYCTVLYSAGAKRRHGADTRLYTVTYSQHSAMTQNAIKIKNTHISLQYNHLYLSVSSDRQREPAGMRRVLHIPRRPTAGSFQ